MNFVPIDSVASAASQIKDDLPQPLRRRALTDSATIRGPPPSGETAPRSVPVEIAFLSAHGVPEQVLHFAAATARRQGVCADEALLAEGLVSEDVYYRALAKHLDVDFIDSPVDVSASGLATAGCGYARVRDASSGVLWLFAPSGSGVFRLMSARRAARGRALFAITTRTRFLEAVRRADPANAARDAAFLVERVDRDLCARGGLRRGQVGWLLLALVGLSASLFAPVFFLRIASALLLAGAFLCGVFLRLFASAASFQEAVDAEPLESDARLPIYTIVIALYQEAAVANQLSRAIDRLDYPRAKLDVKFVIEADDDATAAALWAHAPHAPHEIVIAPEGAPRTKPRALNVAMPLARGSLVAVFDAEDLPEPRQLRRAATLFAALPPNVACLQASLAIDNGGLNWMTAMFALEYAALFDVFNKGLAAMGLPLFLGGTSNHFRIEPLRDIGFWDAFNVTEDADLGLRLARAGFEVRTFASQTFEEAPAVFAALVKQRTRWFKGWLQTFIVHCRRPVRLFVELGARRTFAVLAMFASGLFGPLLGPLLAARVTYDAIFGALLSPVGPLDIALSTLWCFLAVAGAISLILPLAIGMRRRSLTRLRRALIYLPLWLMMLSIAAWRALYELWRRPFHWEKTEHGLTTRSVLDMETTVDPFSSREEPLFDQETGA
ncbi:MAG TPA: glycosyltransferase [Methylocystis sp.]|jgi:cellulose synthase/poly-beta-1,6-N-acetylglucosamine synthase-like glycosyltransferase